MTLTEHVAMILARATLTPKGEAAFDSDPLYWKNCFAASEREKFRKQARVVIRAVHTFSSKESEKP